MIDEKQVLTLHTVELRHVARGSFIDFRGRVADHVLSETDFTFWNMSDARVDFQLSETTRREVAWASHNGIGYQVRRPDTRHYFKDRALKYFGALLHTPGYVLPAVGRFGVRVQCFMRSRLDFEALFSRANANYSFADQAAPFGGRLVDIGPVVVVKRGKVDVRARYGPLSVAESTPVLQNFEATEPPGVGFFLDLDQSVTDLGSLSQKQVASNLSDLDAAAWEVINKFSAVLE